MRRIYSCTGDTEKKLREAFELTLKNFKTNTGKFEFGVKLEDLDPINKETVKKPTVIINPIAWLKMVSLVMHNTKEIAWQSEVEIRQFKDSEETYYYIKEVYVYPQCVSAGYVDVDELKYADWSIKQLTNEQYNALRFQGHSHVNMGVTPSGTDEATYKKFLEQLGKDDYYVFLIMNKRLETTCIVYDFKQNIIFENADTLLDVLLPEGKLLSAWLKETDEMLFEKPQPPANPYSLRGYTGGDPDDYPEIYHYGTPRSAPYLEPVTQGPIIFDKDDGQRITNVTNQGYTKGGVFYRFTDEIEKREFFEDYPIFITTHCPYEPSIRDYLKQAGILNRHGNVRQEAIPENQRPPKRGPGRPRKET